MIACFQLTSAERSGSIEGSWGKVAEELALIQVPGKEAHPPNLLTSS